MQGSYGATVLTRNAHMGAQSHTSLDLSHKCHTVLQDFSPIPDVDDLDSNERCEVC